MGVEPIQTNGILHVYRRANDVVLPVTPHRPPIAATYSGLQHFCLRAYALFLPSELHQP